MISADSITFNDDGTAWLVTDSELIAESYAKISDRPPAAAPGMWAIQLNIHNNSKAEQ